MLKKVLCISFFALAVVCSLTGEVRITGKDKINVYTAEPFAYGFLVAGGAMLIWVLLDIRKGTGNHK